MPDDVTAAAAPAPATGDPTRVFVYGSCVSRDMVSYLDGTRFALTGYVARQSLVSAFSPAAGALAAPEGLSRFQRRMFEGDLAGSLGPRLREVATTTDVVLWDLTDERLGLHRLPDGRYLTRSTDVIGTELGAVLDRTTVHVPFGSDEHFGLWAPALERWRTLLEDVGLLGRTVLVAVPWAERTDDGTATPSSYGVDAATGNRLFQRYVRLAEATLGARMITLPRRAALSSAAHRWGSAPFHYVDDVYEAMGHQLEEHVGALGPRRAAAARSAAPARPATPARSATPTRSPEPAGPAEPARSPGRARPEPTRVAVAVAASVPGPARRPEPAAEQRLPPELEQDAVAETHRTPEVGPDPAATRPASDSAAGATATPPDPAPAPAPAPAPTTAAASRTAAAADRDPRYDVPVRHHPHLAALEVGAVGSRERHLVEPDAARGEVLPLDCLLVRQASPTLVVVLHGAIDRATTPVPRFERYGTLASTRDESMLFLADPTLGLADRLTLAWYSGTATDDLHARLVELVTHVAQACGARQVVLAGAAGGGLAALALGHRIPHSLALGCSPQSAVRNYLPWAAENLRRHVFPEHPDFAAVERQFPDRFDLLQLYAREAAPGARFWWVQNVQDEHHLTEHMLPFADVVKIDPAGGYSPDGRGLLTLEDWGPGHRAPDPARFRALLDRAACVVPLPV